jgi:hypothetical protein
VASASLVPKPQIIRCFPEAAEVTRSRERRCLRDVSKRIPGARGGVLPDGEERGRRREGVPYRRGEAFEDTEQKNWEAERRVNGAAASPDQRAGCERADFATGKALLSHV